MFNIFLHFTRYFVLYILVGNYFFRTGQRFAMLEIKSLLVHILLRYRVMPVTRVEDVVFVADIILRPKDVIKVQFILR